MSAGSETQGRAADGRPPVILRSVGKRFGGMQALARVDLEVATGEVVALVGANGSGKTTLLRLVAGLSRPSEGVVTVLGWPAGSRAARRAVALVPDEPAGLDELTVAEHVGLLARLAGAEPEAGLGALEELGLGSRLDERVGALSRGLRRRASLAAALAARPRVLLADEVTATLDATSVDAVARLLRVHVRAGGTALVATHDLGFVAAACDRVHVLRCGRLVGSGPAATARALAGLAGSPPPTSEPPAPRWGHALAAR